MKRLPFFFLQLLAHSLLAAAQSGSQDSTTAERDLPLQWTSTDLLAKHAARHGSARVARIRRVPRDSVLVGVKQIEVCLAALGCQACAGYIPILGFASPRKFRSLVHDGDHRTK